MNPIDPARSPEPPRGSSASHETLTEAIFHEALAMPRESRESFLAHRLADDSGLRRFVRELLAQHEEAEDEGGFLLASGPDPGRSMSDRMAGDEITSANARYRIL